jgi:hypothetical protein
VLSLLLLEVRLRCLLGEACADIPASVGLAKSMLSFAGAGGGLLSVRLDTIVVHDA